MNVGDEWIYRLKTYSPSERVRIVSIERRKQTTRVNIEFLDGDRIGIHENVPGSRLRGPWSAVEAFDKLMGNWQRLNDSALDETEERAVGDAFGLLIPESVASYDESPVRYGTTVWDRTALETLLRLPLQEVLDQVEWFEREESLELSAAGTLLIARLVCNVNPAPILEAVMKEEAEARERCKRGREFEALDGSGKQTSPPEWEFERYRKGQSRVHELLRGWCGHRAVTFVERLTAAEAEVRRLDILIAQLIPPRSSQRLHSAAVRSDELAGPDVLIEPAIRTT